MPIFLEPKDVTADLEGFNSVLIVSCPMCPPMSLSAQKKEPFIEFFKHGLKTPAFEDYIKSIREPLEERGVQTDAFTMRAPSPLMCLWTEGQRQKLLQRAKDFDAVLVLGCSSATTTAKETLKDTDTKVFQAMRMKGIANAKPKFQFPGNLTIDMRPMRKKRENSAQDETSSVTKESNEGSSEQKANH